MAAKLADTGAFTQIDMLEVGGPGAPMVTAATLAPYQAVLVWSSLGSSFADPAGLGNALAAYVDSGGGVVQATLTFGFGGIGLGGAWESPTGGYLPFREMAPIIQGIPRTMNVLVPGHPILDGVTSFHGGATSLHQQALPVPGTTVVARWSDNLSLIGARPGPGPGAGRIVGLNFFPPSDDGVAGGWDPATDGARILANALLYVLAPPPFSHAPVATPAGACICTPLVANTDAEGSQQWWVRALGGPLTVTAVAHAVNSVDPEMVEAKVYDPQGNLVTTVATGYAGGQVPGSETSASQTIAADAGAIYRISVTTPGTPASQSHYRLVLDGGDTVATSSPSSPSFTTERATWYFNAGAGEMLEVRVSVEGTPAAASTLVYTLVDPNGIPMPGSVTATPGSDAVISGLAPLEGTWTLRVEAATDYYRLDKTSGADTGIYLSWESAGSGALHVDAVSSSGGPVFAGAVQVNVRDATGAVVASGVTTDGVLDLPGLPSGIYTVEFLAPGGFTAVPASITVTISCGSTAAVETVVADTAPPVIVVPEPIVTTATSAAGAIVEYVVSADDPGTGPLPVSCEPASGSVFAIGTTTVTCTAVDADGNETTETFTVTVEDVSMPGQMHGIGYIHDHKTRYDFAFVVRETERRGERGAFALRVTEEHGRWWQRWLRSDVFVSREIDFVAFSDDPTSKPGRKPRPNVDTVRFTGTGRWNGKDGYRFEVVASDRGEPGRHRESVRITIFNPSGAVVAHVDGEIDGGNVQSSRVRH